MSYSVQELRDNLSEKILSLGISRDFLNNPAYKAALEEIDELISQLNMFEEAKEVMVESDGTNISFKFTGPDATAYYVEISKKDDKCFKCFKTEERKPYLGTNGEYIKEKNMLEDIITLDDSGFVVIETNGSFVNDINASNGLCNNTCWAQKKTYNANGVMQEREYIGFPTGVLNEPYDRVTSNSSLYLARRAFDGTLANFYEARTILRRDKLDTARIYAEDKTRDLKYSAVIPLNQEHGLRDMNMMGGYDPYLKEIAIRPLSLEEVERMLEKEKDPKIKEGLKAFAQGRENYQYNSLDDPYFVYEHLSNNVEIKR